MHPRDDAHAWAATLWRALPCPRQGQPPAALEAAVVIAWRLVRQVHPPISVPAIDWFQYLGPRFHDGDPAEELARRNVSDLYLACGCAREDPAALEILECQVLPAVARKLANLRLAADQRADLMQTLRERMLVAVGGERGIAAYDGRAPLAMWLGVGAARIGRRQVGHDRRAAVQGDRQLDHVAPGVPDPSLLYLKRHYGAQFRAAFAEAVDSLEPRQRNLLRHAVLDELGIDQIAAIYHVHRATAARQLRHARAALIEATRNRMRAALRISEAELESILRGVMSMADVTLRTVLARGRGQDGEAQGG